MTRVADRSPQPSDDAAEVPRDEKEPSGADTPEGSSAPRRRTAVVTLIGVAVVVLALDLITKQLVLSHMRPATPWALIPGVLYVFLIRNSGAAFSLGTTHTWIFPTITILVIAWIAWMAQRLRSVPWAIAFGLVLGGAFGNLSDRLFRAPGPMRGEVVDFLSLFSRHGAHFAVFNVADSALSCGVALAILLELLGRRRDGSRHVDPGKSERSEETVDGEARG